MATDTTDRKATKSSPPEPEHLPCPRCDSTNTKFCYYNNYNFSQPRHFCKACRRYWTHGGTLRDIPIGGGTRKNTAKRSRTTAVYSPGYHDLRHLPEAAAASQLLVPLSGVHHGGSVAAFMGEGKMGSGSFTSLLNNAQGCTGLVALGGFGLGLDDVGFGLGRVVWPFPAVVEGGPPGGNGGGGSSVGGNTWQLESGDQSGFVGGGGDHCFAWPDLAISTPGSVFK